MEIALLGHMGRDEAAAERLTEHKLHVIGEWYNPGLVEKTEASGGSYNLVDSVKNTKLVADIIESIRPDMFFTNFDDALAAGVVDAVQMRVSERRLKPIYIPSPTREAAKVEWDKFFLREIIDAIDPKYNPVNFMAENKDDLEEAFDYFESREIPVALKPRNLTGGKGVKVMGKHFDSFQQARVYAAEVINSSDQEGIEVQEKLEGQEFTLQIFTDGKIMIAPPATYDYPYREDGDVGPGTGGMGTFTMPAGQHLPFLSASDYQEAMDLMPKILEELKKRNQDYKGVLYSSFFKTKEGLKIVEINARGGDPELINILDLLEDDVDFAEILQQIAQGELEKNMIRFKKLASAMVYLVSPDYGYRKGSAFEFELNPAGIIENDCKIRFAAAERIAGNKFKTVGSSRTVGLSALGATPWEAREKIHRAIAEGFIGQMELEYRLDIADKLYISNLK